MNEIIERYRKLLTQEIMIANPDAIIVIKLMEGDEQNDVHLLAMLDIIQNDSKQSITKKHRWLGYVQGIMIAKNYISEMEKEKSDSICKLNDKILQLEKKQKSVTFVNTDVSANINNTIIDNSAILYLDSNKVWQRGQMNSIKCLEGLWDDLNSRKKTRIMKWNEKLSQSNKWKKIRDNVKINGSTHFRDTTKRQYDIVVEDYIKSFQSKTGATKSTKSEEVQNSAKKRIGQLD